MPGTSITLREGKMQAHCFASHTSRNISHKARQMNPLFSQIYEYIYMQYNAYKNTHFPFIIEDVTLFSPKTSLTFSFVHKWIKAIPNMEVTFI